MKMAVGVGVFFLYWVLLLLLQCQVSVGQQTYVNNKQLDCEQNYTNTLGFVCNGASSCLSYLTFRSNPPYNSPVSIGYLLNVNPSDIARLNDISDVQTIPTDTLVIVPLNCSCSSSGYYQYNASYVLKSTDETYFTVANITYEGLTTCQALIAQNPTYFRNLVVGLNVTIPLRCACPTSNQTATGVNYLLSYLIAVGDNVESIGDTFGGVGIQSILDANELSSNDLIFPFTPLLVPLKTEPTINTTVSQPPPPPSPPQLPAVPSGGSSNSSHKWVFVGIGVGAAFLILVLAGFLIWFFRRHRRQAKPIPGPPKGKKPDESADYTDLPNNKSSSVSVSSEGVRYAIESLAVYKFEDLQKATGLSGFCVHEGNTYLVYEYAEKGSVSDWLHDSKKRNQRYGTSLSWKQRVQIAYDVADALNYLHNYTNPPYVHKNLKSSNILLDGNMRAKIANFGLARRLENQDQGGLQLTRHVVGTHGYMAPEYIENGLVTPKLDVFALGVVMLELLSGREAAAARGDEEELLHVRIKQVVGEEKNVREKLRGFMDEGLGQEYPLDLVYSMAQLANKCVHHDLNSRPSIHEVFMILSKIRSSSLDWDPSDELESSRSLGRGR
ncbi:hypothetical protein F0562_017886 [Nyssa sinensis]|uniref:Protein kinase domain-containing protein n=1 Tax=Nyssa sinensis TaxID=561372 RepID=A0A5J4ZBG9_9ASTE|nr:hypothetical protein F0562_017886 [Nyssa sinensis]